MTDKLEGPQIPEPERQQDQAREGQLDDAPANQQDHAREQWLDRMLRDLPSRRAPATLEARVLAELRRRAALPWWRRSFAHWPWPARTAFVAICIGFTGLVLWGGSWMMTTFDSLHPPDALAALPLQQAMGMLSVATVLAAVSTHLISPLWLYSTVAVAAALYAMLFGLGAVAYRTLYLKPPGGR